MITLQQVPGVQYLPSVPLTPVSSPTKIETPGEGLPRAVNYLADYGGCALYRCMAANQLINLHQRGIVVESTTMVLDPNFYGGLKAVKIQRQATSQQLEFVKLLKKLSEQHKFRLIYEVDDIVFREDIPDYNRNKAAFIDDSIRNSVQTIMELCDEITVTTPFMQEYFRSKLNKKEVTAIPNYLPRWWFDRWFDILDRQKTYELGKKKKHKIAIFASGTHVDVLGKTMFQDDFSMVWPYIEKTKKEYEWCFYGAYPLQLKHLLKSGEISFVPWTPLPDFPRAMAQSGASVTFAALQPNNFNFAKSPIKMLESGALGIPCVCPDMCTYQDAHFKYTTGNEFIDQIKTILKDPGTYLQYCKKARKYTDQFWLEDERNYMKHHEVYFEPYGSSQRKLLDQMNKLG